MSMHPQVFGPIPEETTRVAYAAFPRGNRYLIMRDQSRITKIIAITVLFMRFSLQLRLHT